MISSTVTLALQELDNADLEKACARFILAAHMIALANDPRSTHDGASISSGKPGSRLPGREKCRKAVEKLVDLSKQAENRAFVAVTKCAEDETAADVVEQVSGISVVIPAIDGTQAATRRKNGTYAMNPAKLHERLTDAAKHGIG